jgi:hypothetical protein
MVAQPKPSISTFQKNIGIQWSKIIGHMAWRRGKNKKLDLKN